MVSCAAKQTEQVIGGTGDLYNICLYSLIICIDMWHTHHEVVDLDSMQKHR